ncbi:MAG TPA: exodeoxyribonuclease III [Alphaproteobacteria bacterium]|nr:exodeoxyribonuclease III [Alphaproteobacteria bacterium]
MTEQFRIATWNVNSVRARLANVLAWAERTRPDVLLLQELKTVEADFPHDAFTGLGYAVHAVGQKAYNGVALLSREPAEVTARALPGDDTDEQARYIEARVRGLRIASLYLPNGNPVGTEKFDYKLRWMARLRAHAKALLATEEPVVLGGDYNVIPAEEDVHDPAAWMGDALFRPESRAEFRALLNLGYTDAFRALDDRPHQYTFWDYQAGRWHRDEGIRIDHFLLSPQAADRLTACQIDRAPRGEEKASDHTPVICTLSV